MGALRTALDHIWRRAFKRLGLDTNALQDTCCVLVLPDQFDRREGYELLSLLLDFFGFKAIIAHEEAACACFGAGVPSACVVDVGGSRSSVCCVDEGVPMPGCRQMLNYGGDDMDVLLYWLLRRQGLAPPLVLPLLPASVAAGMAAAPTAALSAALPPVAHNGLRNLIAAVRHSCCHLHFDDAPDATTGAAQAEAQAEAQAGGGGGGVRFELGGSEHVLEGTAHAGRLRAALGSFAPLPPLLLFAPSSVALMRGHVGAAAWHGGQAAPSVVKRAARAMGVGEDGGFAGEDEDEADTQGATHDEADACPRESRLDYSDCLDDDYLVESAGPLRGAAGMRDDGEPGLPPLSREKERERAAAALQASQPLPTMSDLGSRHQACLTPDESADYMPLDEAVVRMVERGKSTEVKRRMYGTILLLGSASHTPGLAAYLEWRVEKGWKLAPDSTEGIERVEVLRLPRGVSGEWLAWRGAASLPTLDSAVELWITRNDWVQRGVMAAREACAFTW